MPRHRSGPPTRRPPSVSIAFHLGRTGPPACPRTLGNAARQGENIASDMPPRTSAPPRCAALPPRGRRAHLVREAHSVLRLPEVEDAEPPFPAVPAAEREDDVGPVDELDLAHWRERRLALAGRRASSRYELQHRPL